jgi:nucleoside-diphosphate-sugar epimerase
MDKILVLGGSGFVGSFLIKLLPQATYLVRKSSNTTHLKGADLVYGDILKYQELLSAAQGVDIIINLTGPSKQMGNINTDVIIEGTKNIIKVSKELGIKRLINLSSMAAKRKALGPYGEAKKEADKLLENSTYSIVNLKPTLIFGKGGAIFQKLLKMIDGIPKIVPVVGEGHYKIQPIYIKDLVQAVNNSIKLPLKSGQIKTYELGGPEPITYRDFINKILQIRGSQKRLYNIPLKLIYFIVKLIPGLNKTTIDRALETIKIDTEKSSAELNLNLTSYNQALKETLKD